MKNNLTPQPPLLKARGETPPPALPEGEGANSPSFGGGWGKVTND
jgi:hypothetical protein